MEGVSAVGNSGDVHPLQNIASAPATYSTEEEFFESEEFVEIVVNIGVSNLVFHYMMSRILEISTTDVIIEAMDLHK